MDERWQRAGKTWLHPDCQFFVVQRAGGKRGFYEYHVVRSGGDSTAGFSVAVFSTAEEAIADAERLDALLTGR